MDSTQIDKLWQISADAWEQSGEITGFVRDQIGGLDLTESGKQFFLDVLSQRIRPGRRQHLPREIIRVMYRHDLPIVQQRVERGQMTLPDDSSPSKYVKQYLAERFKTSAATIDQIVSERKSRQPRKPRQS